MITSQEVVNMGSSGWIVNKTTVIRGILPLGDKINVGLEEKYINIKKKLAKWQWAILGLTVFTLVLKTISRSYPVWVEAWYTNGLYNFIRWIFDILTGWIPFAFIYVVGLALVIVLIKASLKWWKMEGKWPKAKSATLGILLLAGGLYASFTWLWGFNYEKTAFTQKHDLQSFEIPDSILLSDLEDLSQKLAILRLELNKKDSIIWNDLPEDLAVQVRSTLDHGLARMGYEIKGKLRAKYLYPMGSLLRISTAGIFLPFSGEGHIDPGLHPLQIPFVMAHEMSHAQGFTNEGVCNFVAYYAMANSDESFLRYCGLLGYFRYLASQCRRLNPEWYLKFFQELDPILKGDLIDIAENGRRYPDILPKLRDITYDQYLKAQGIQDGIRSYNTVVRLHYQWEKRNGPILLAD